MELETVATRRAEVDYCALFTGYLEASAQNILRRLAATQMPQEELRSQALLTLDYALARTATWALAGDLLLAMSPGMEQAGRWDEWLPYLHQGIAVSQLTQDGARELQLSYYVGMLLRRRGEYTDARRWFERAVTLGEQQGDGYQQGKALNQLGYVARLQARHAEAQAYIARALACLAPDDPECATGYWVLGTVAQARAEWDEAIRCHEKALELRRSAGDERRTAWSLQNLGDTYWQMRRYPEATRYLSEAIQALDRLHDRVNVAIARMNLGIVHAHQRLPDEALAYYALAEPIFREVGDRRHLAMVLNNIAYAQRMRQAWQPALAAAQESVRHWEALGDPTSLANTLDELGLAQEALGDLDAAIATYARAWANLNRSADGPSPKWLATEIQQHLDAARARRTG